MTNESLRNRTFMIIEKALKAARNAGADEAAAMMNGGRSGLTRFARNKVIQNVESDSHVLSLAVSVGNREAGLTTDVLDDDTIIKVARDVVEMARIYPENPEHTSPVEPVEISDSHSFSQETADYPQIEKINRIKKICEKTASEGLLSFGTLTTGWKYAAFGNSLGHRAWHPESIADFSLTLRTENGEGSCRENRGFHDIEKIDFNDLRERCSAWALWSTEAEYLKPGDYKVIITPTAALSYLMWAFWAMGSRKVAEKRSALTSHFSLDDPLGKQLFSPEINVYSRTIHPECSCSPFGAAFDMDGQGMVSGMFGNGLPVEDFPIIEKGVQKHLFSSLYWARKNGLTPRAFPSLIEFIGSEKSLKQLIEKTDHAILVNSFWYIRLVDINSLLLTGLTRDGVFLVENGKIIKPLKNLRFNESPLVSLGKIVDIGKPELRNSWFNKILIPPMVINDFSFSTETAAV
ncbi:TldD/PmbA family protein [bacterium]|nr:TldD/PmbA family protein [bacterium]